MNFHLSHCIYFCEVPDLKYNLFQMIKSSFLLDQ